MAPQNRAWTKKFDQSNNTSQASTTLSAPVSKNNAWTKQLNIKQVASVVASNAPTSKRNAFAKAGQRAPLVTPAKDEIDISILSLADSPSPMEESVPSSPSSSSSSVPWETRSYRTICEASRYILKGNHQSDVQNDVFAYTCVNCAYFFKKCCFSQNELVDPQTAYCNWCRTEREVVDESVWGEVKNANVSWSLHKHLDCKTDRKSCQDTKKPLTLGQLEEKIAAIKNRGVVEYEERNPNVGQIGHPGEEDTDSDFDY